VGVSARRPIRLGCFDVRQGVVVVVDQSLLIACADDLGNSPVSIAEIPQLIELSAGRLC
jgi:hypothetical protein